MFSRFLRENKNKKDFYINEKERGRKPMKAIMVMYDSLNREMLGSYGCNWTKTPNFKRLAEKRNEICWNNNYLFIFTGNRRNIFAPKRMFYA